MKANPALFLLGGALNLLVGLAVLSTYSSWSFGLPVLLTLFGWVWAIRGVLTLFMPEKVVEWGDMLQSQTKNLSYIPIVWGLLLCWLAFL